MGKEILQHIQNGAVVPKSAAIEAAQHTGTGSYIISADHGDLAGRAFTVVKPEDEIGEIKIIESGGELVSKTSIPKVIFDAFAEPEKQTKSLRDFY